MPRNQHPTRTRGGPSAPPASAPPSTAPPHPASAKHPNPPSKATTTKTILHRPLSGDSATPGAQQRRRQRLRSVARALRHAERGDVPQPRPPRGQDGQQDGDGGGAGGAKRRRQLPATTRAGLERELAALRREDAVARAEAARGRAMRKYKMVRFFGTQALSPFFLNW
jgi:hypothetical protein